MFHQYLEKELTDLCQEVGEYHPDVMAVLTALTDKDIYMQIAAISAHCGMILHGTYTKEDILGICKTLTKKLRDKRTIHIQGIITMGSGEEPKKLELDMSMVRSLPEAPKSFH